MTVALIVFAWPVIGLTLGILIGRAIGHPDPTDYDTPIPYSPIETFDEHVRRALTQANDGWNGVDQLQARRYGGQG